MCYPIGAALRKSEPVRCGSPGTLAEREDPYCNLAFANKP
jgi:hypothetical protein